MALWRATLMESPTPSVKQVVTKNMTLPFVPLLLMFVLMECGRDLEVLHHHIRIAQVITVILPEIFAEAFAEKESD